MVLFAMSGVAADLNSSSPVLGPLTFDEVGT